MTEFTTLLENQSRYLILLFLPCFVAAKIKKSKSIAKKNIKSNTILIKDNTSERI